MTADQLLRYLVTDMTSIGNDAGWHGESALQMLIEFKGDLPSKGGGGKSNAKMIHEIRFLRRPTLEESERRLIIALLTVLYNQQAKYAEAVFYQHYLPRKQNKLMTDRMIADELGVSVSSYRHNRDMGRKKLEELRTNHLSINKAMGAA